MKKYILLLTLIPLPCLADTSDFLLGMVSPLIAHEMGHQIVGGKDISWHGPQWECVRPCNASRIASGGFISEVGFSEFSNRFIGNKDYKNGVNLSTSIHLLTYVLRNNEDLDNFSNKRRAKFFLIAASAYFAFKIEF